MPNLAYREDMKHTPHAIIIGGGIAGPAASLFLRRAGIESEIFEAYPEPATIGGGFQIAPNGMRALNDLGLADQVRAAGVLSSDFVFRNQHGKVICRIDVSESGHGVTVRRSDFHRILTDEVTRQNVPVHYGKRLCAIEHTYDVVVAHFEDGHVQTGDMLLAADGVHSRARALILPENASPRYTGFLAVGGFAEAGRANPVDPEDAHHLNFTVGPRFQFGYAMISEAPESWGWWTHLPQNDELTRAELQTISDDSMRDRVLAAFRGWHSPIEALASNTKQIMRTAIYDVPSLPAWHVGRVMLLGDAAHAMSPAGGQGASLALEDAMLAGKSLADQSRSVTQTFAAAESLLRARAERLVKQAAENDLRQVKELGPLGQWIRNQAFPLFAPLIARELRRQYAALQEMFAPAA
jgi:2-polyprenyl-6-methoxyphenol hydroxylase-like FAD-dependent oxidoreductase